LTDEAPGVVSELRSRGVRFDVDEDGKPALGLEGGHTRRRIVHAGGSRTGRELTSRLAAMIAAEPRIEVRERTSALALWSDGDRCGGVITDAGPVAAATTILATGGAAALWRRTTNPWGAIGAGAVLGQAAGADLADLEFCQFHPTALALPGTAFDGLLITEAVRGEGATLLDVAGRRFTDELAPRDAVSAAVLARMDADGTAHVMLDLRPIDPARFPSVFSSLAEAGLDAAREPVPVAPAAHYMTGGVAVDLEGRASVSGLFAVGECACSGVHGANRLASNSLSECFVFGRRAAKAALGVAPGPPPEQPEWRFTPPTDATRDALWRLAGPLREPAALRRLLEDRYPLAGSIAASALARNESRGGHRRADAPAVDPSLDGVHFLIDTDRGLRREEWR
jgi:L-aspartate oxidase